MTTQRKMSILASVLCAGVVQTGWTATSAYWTFQDQEPGVLATTLVSEVHSDVLVGQGKSNGSGRLPSHDADVPATKIYDGLFGPLLNSNNTASLYFTNAVAYPAQTNSQNGGYVEVADVPSLLCPTNFTIEFFVKIARDVDWPLLVGKARERGASWAIDIDRNNSLKLRMDTQPIDQPGTTNGFNENLLGSNIQDGKWHHVAVTYSASKKTATFYVDYEYVSSKASYAHEVTYNTNNYPLLMGRGAGSYQAFDGWLDEVRLSDVVLAPHQFLRTYAVPEDAQLYYTFDDAATVPSTATTLVCEAHSPAMDGLTADTRPTFSPDIPPASTTRITQGYKGTVVNADNSSSLFFVNTGLPGNTDSAYGGQVAIPGFLHPSNFTVEVFFKMNRHVNYSLLVGKVRTGSSPTWSLSLSGADDLVRCRFDTYPVDWNLGEHTYAENSQNGFNQCFSTGVPGNDGKWHHAAFSYETATKNVKIYVDYVLKANGTTINPIVYTDGDILIGMGAGERAFDGWIDEVRITPRLLTPDEFLYTQPRLGTLITLD
ncbi:MAG TPA: LamG domain-containing protein [Kiritimatiellia bacterium]|nr:LamG domain-containing protein [Kiritimatiellia bacterium]